MGGLLLLPAALWLAPTPGPALSKLNLLRSAVFCVLSQAYLGAGTQLLAAAASQCAAAAGPGAGWLPAASGASVFALIVGYVDGFAPPAFLAELALIGRDLSRLAAVVFGPWVEHLLRSIAPPLPRPTAHRRTRPRRGAGQRPPGDDCWSDWLADEGLLWDSGGVL